MRISLTQEQAEDLKLIAGFELTVPKAIAKKHREYFEGNLSQVRKERLTETLVAIFQKLDQ